MEAEIETTLIKLCENNILSKTNLNETNEYDLAASIRFIQSTGKTLRQIAQKHGIPLGTLHGWLSWDKFNKEDIKLIKEKGIKSKVHNILKKNSKLSKEEIIKKALEDSNELKINVLLKYFNKEIHPFITNGLEHDYKTAGFIKELINTLNRILIRVDQ